MLDPQARALLAQLESQSAPDLADLAPEECRAFFGQLVASVDAPQADVDVQDHQAGHITVRVYKPRNAAPDLPAVVYYHGGGWVIGSLDDYHGVCSQLCAKSGCAVVSVDYRLAPEHPFPAAVDDAFHALEWLTGHAAELGLDKTRLAVAGDSAGGNLAAVVCLLARDRGGPAICFQALIYPAVAIVSDDYDSFRNNGEGYFLTARSMRYFGSHYQPDPADPRAAPLHAETLEDLPPALVLVAGYDPLRDEGVAYANRLIEAGVPAVLTEYSGMIHGFFNMAGVMDAAGQAHDQVAGALRAALLRT